MEVQTGRQLALRPGCAPAGQGLAPGSGVLASKSLQDVVEHVGIGLGLHRIAGLKPVARALDLGSMDL